MIKLLNRRRTTEAAEAFLDKQVRAGNTAFHCN